MPFAYKPTDTWTFATRPFGIGKCVPFYTTEIDKSSVAALPPDQNEPGCVAMLVYNDSGSTILKNKAVARKAATVSARIRVMPATSHGSLFMGVTLADIANGSVGFIAVKGQCGIIADTANVTADTRVKIGATDGMITDSASTDHFAFAHETKTSGNVAKVTLLWGADGPLADLG